MKGQWYHKRWYAKVSLAWRFLVDELLSAPWLQFITVSYSAMKWWRHVSYITKNQWKKLDFLVNCELEQHSLFIQDSHTQMFIKNVLIRVLASPFSCLYRFDQNLFWNTSAIPQWNDGAIFIHYQISTQKSGLLQVNKFQQYSLIFVHCELAWSSSRQTCSSHNDSLWSAHFSHNLNITFRV